MEDVKGELTICAAKGERPVLDGSMALHGGRDNRVYGNVFVGCPYAVSHTSWDEGHWEKQFEGQQKLIDKYGIFSSTYIEKYPELKDIHDGKNNRNYIHDNLAVDVKDFGLRTDNNEMWNNVTISSGGHDTRYFTTRKLLGQYGMDPIPFDRMGPGEGSATR